MENKGQILKELANVVLEFDEDAAKAVAQRALEAGIDPSEAIDNGLRKGLETVGKKFESGDLYLPHLIMASDAMLAAVKILEKAIPKERIHEAKLGTIVIGTVADDIHDIGKNIVIGMLRSAGFEVHDLGRDVPTTRFVETAEGVKADIIALSALMTTTMHRMKEVIDDLKSLGLRNKYRVMVGGGPVTREWAESIGADGYGENAPKAVEVAKKLLGKL